MTEQEKIEELKGEKKSMENNMRTLTL